MSTPEFITNLRTKIGNDPLWLTGITAYVEDAQGRILLGKRADTGQWALIYGIVEPAEEPANTCVREALEETGVDIEPVCLVSVKSSPYMVTYANGDRCQYMDLLFSADHAKTAMRSPASPMTKALKWAGLPRTPFPNRWRHPLDRALSWCNASSKNAAQGNPPACSPAPCLAERAAQNFSPSHFAFCRIPRNRAVDPMPDAFGFTISLPSLYIRRPDGSFHAQPHYRASPPRSPPACSFALFAALTVSLVFVDRQPIAGDGSLVGLATFNLDARVILGQNDLMEKLSNALLIVPAVGAHACHSRLQAADPFPKPQRGRSRSLAVAGNLRRYAGAIRAVQLLRPTTGPSWRTAFATVVPLVAHAACRHHVRHGHDPGRATHPRRGPSHCSPGHLRRGHGGHHRRTRHGGRSLGHRHPWRHPARRGPWWPFTAQ